MFQTDQGAYVALRDIVSERTSPLVAWVGSGLSTSAGLPSWSSLRESLCQVLQRKIRDFDDSDEEKIKRFKAKLEFARREDDFWRAFQVLQDSLGQASYEGEIRRAFSIADDCEIPENYILVWKLPLSGIFTLNMDRLATRAHGEVAPKRIPIEFEGKRAGNFTHVLQGRTPFIANLHGIRDDASSWVFTKDELVGLQKNEAYQAFVRATLLSRTVIFMGISADDVAVGSHLQTLKSLGVSFSNHFWITDRSDSGTDAWGEELGIRRIQYTSRGSDHGELRELLVSLHAHNPVDVEPMPIELMTPVEELPRELDSDTLDRSTAEELRKLLNAHATHILAQGDDRAREEYKEFLSKYAEAIYRSWFVTVTEPKNVLLGYTLISEIAEGAFGRVFKARRADGEEVALKLLRVDVMEKPGMLQSFRRGIQSMRILSRHCVDGMVPHHEAGEIPSFAVMEFINGPNLRQAVEARYLDDWNTILRISSRLATIVRTAHQLPERVLHRDLRPENIMLKNYYIDPTAWEVVVLDFDLSWHIGATDLSVVAGEAAHGFLAPEQIQRDKKVSTRNAAVDSFGLGMTLFFIRSGRAPRHLEHMHRDWHDTLLDLSRRHPCVPWKSLPLRFARLVENCTRNEQADRMDMAQIEGELLRLMEVELSPDSVVSTELLAEEVAVRVAMDCLDDRFYHWNSDRMEATLVFPSGVKLSILAMEEKQTIELNVTWSNKGDSSYANAKKYIGPKCERSIQMLVKNGWTNHSRIQLRSDSVHFGMIVDVNILRKNLEKACEAIRSVSRELVIQ